MIQIGDTSYSLSDPAVIAGAAIMALMLLLLALMIVAVRRAGAAAQANGPVMQQVGALSQRVQ
ncbi:MAG: DNA recombination protein RmuC, partial [Tropicimonas sp.]